MGHGVDAPKGIDVPFVIHGSFNKHLGEVEAAAYILNTSGVAHVVAPHDCEAVGATDGFVLFRGQEGQDPKTIEARYLQAVLRMRSIGGASLFVNPKGYVGKSMAYEAGIVHASGGRAFWTHEPEDVPFYVSPDTIVAPAQLVEQIERYGQLPPRKEPSTEADRTWFDLRFPVGSVAVGAVVETQSGLLLVEDGRWSGRLTIPGTQVRAGETRGRALDRLLSMKVAVDASHVAALKTSFMIPNSGYEGSAGTDTFVFDDRLVKTTQRQFKAPGLRVEIIPPKRLGEVLGTGQIEPNAADLLTHYLEHAA